MAPLTRTPDENGRTTPGLLSNNPRVAFFEWAAVHTNKLSLENASNTFFQVYLTGLPFSSRGKRSGRPGLTATAGYEEFSTRLQA